MSEVEIIRDRLHMVRATLQGMLSDPNVTRTIDLTPEIAQCGEALSALERLADRPPRIREQINSEWNATVEQMEAEIAMLRRCLSEHHAVGVLDAALAGDKCPVCAKWLAESNWCYRP